jgi:N-acetylglutamate synthase-like GNAT family acetyltransferase
MTTAPPQFRLRRLSVDGEDWPAILALILRAFSSMEGRIDPPSSALRLTLETLAAKARDEIGLLVEEGGRPVACAFLDLRPDCLYIGKLAVEPDRQGSGAGKLLLAEAERIAAERHLPWLELQTRVELVENHRYFAARGFAKTGEGSHSGYPRPTWIVMRKRVRNQMSDATGQMSEIGAPNSDF